jgi:hypothetical protein
VEDVDCKFAGLTELEARGWAEAEEVVRPAAKKKPVAAPRKQLPAATRKPIASTSGIHRYISTGFI